jgi:AcrR family transcriptional regulator
MTESRTAARAALSRDRVVDQALVVAAEHGIETLTIRRLATDLGVTPMALYWHFTTKDDLLAGIADRLLDGAVLPEPVDDWAEDLRLVMRALVDALRPHPQVAHLVTKRVLLHPTGLAITERVLSGLSRAGFDPDRASAVAAQWLRSAISMVTAEQVDASGRTAAERAEALRAKQARLAALPVDRYPNLVAHAAAMAWCDAPTYLGVNEDLVIAGLRGLAAAAQQ